MRRLNAKVILGVAIGLLLLAQGCQQGGVKALESKPVSNRQEADLANLIYVNLGTPYAEVVAKFGNPDASVGSGFLIVVYNLPDGRRIYLNFGGRAKLEEISETGKDGVTRRIAPAFPPTSKPATP